MDSKFCALTNIPKHFHTADLRAHFSQLVESKSFTCFHYRHRPEKDEPNRCCCLVTVYKNKLTELLRYNNQHWTDNNGEIYGDVCQISQVAVTTTDQDCLLSCTDFMNEKILLQMPELKPPELMSQGNVGTPTLVFLDLIQRCLLPQSLVKKLNLIFPKTRSKRLYDNVYLNYNDPNDEFNDKMCVNLKNLKGTSLHTFISPKPVITEVNNQSCEDSIQSSTTAASRNNFCCVQGKSSFCSICKQTSNYERTETSQLDNDRFKSVDTGNQQTSDSSIKSVNEVFITYTDHQFKKPIISNTLGANVETNYESEKMMNNKERNRKDKEDRRLTRKLMAEGIEERLIASDKKYQNDEDAEEWDRHESSEDDPSNQERNKERLYEEEIEQPWEKGGPGVLFYTDAMYWQKREGDFDEQTTDDLDVDFSAYDEPGAGDKDIKDFLKIRQQKRFRSGYDNTDRFSIGIGKTIQTQASSHSGENAASTSRSKIGAFERFSKGFGRKVMERQGWRDGKGLGSSRPGIVEALRGEGQKPQCKRGLGYVDPEPQQFRPSAAKNVKHRTQHFITTVYDNPREVDPKEPLLQRSELSTLKHRQSCVESFEKKNKNS